MRERFLTAESVTLHLVEAGEDRDGAVLFLHGFPEFWYGWRQQIIHFASIGHWVVVPDQRGYNLSEKPRPVAAYGLDRLADDIAGLLDTLGLKRAHVVGHDWGGIVAWWLALKHPERLRRLAVLNAPHPIIMRRHLRQNRAQRKRSWYIFFFQLPWLPELWMRRRRWRKATAALKSTSRPGTFDEATMDNYRQAWNQERAMTCMIHWYRAALRHPPKEPSDYQVSVPTLLLWGARDRFLGQEMAQPSIELCSRGELVLVEDATHWLQHEVPEHVNGLLQQFLATDPKVS